MKYPEDFVNKIICGDCLEVMKDIPDKSIDMILCDLPYGTTACKWDVIIPFEPLWEQYKRIIKHSRAIILTSSQPFTSVLVLSNINQFKYEWIWKKNRGSNFLSLKSSPMKEHESVSVFSDNSLSVYNPIKQERAKSGQTRVKYDFNPSNTGKRDAYGGFISKTSGDIGKLRCPSSVQEFKTEVGLHPTQKPVSLFEYLIRTYTNDEEVVLDNCIGSGTTAIACINTNRNFIGIEKEQKYCDITRKRLSEVV